MTTNRYYNVQFETTLEFYPPHETPIYVEAYVETMTDSDYGADADGRRGMERVFVEEIRIDTLRLYLPERPALLICSSEGEVMRFLTDDEFQYMIDRVGDEVLAGRGEEV